jgi:hypothetical protein
MLSCQIIIESGRLSSWRTDQDLIGRPADAIGANRPLVRIAAVLLTAGL